MEAEASWTGQVDDPLADLAIVLAHSIIEGVGQTDADKLVGEISWHEIAGARIRGVEKVLYDPSSKFAYTSLATVLGSAAKIDHWMEVNTARENITIGVAMATTTATTASTTTARAAVVVCRRHAQYSCAVVASSL